MDKLTVKLDNNGETIKVEVSGFSDPMAAIQALKTLGKRSSLRKIMDEYPGDINND